MQPEFEARLEQLTEQFPGKPCLGSASDLHLFHAPNSVCSQKVRSVLYELNLPFISHELNLVRGDTYEPEYVLMRLDGCEAAGLPLSTSHGEAGEGSTSVALTGCDPCVVPMLIDARKQAIHVDSRNISTLLAKAAPRLYPEAFRSDIERQLSVIDDLPNYQLLAVFVTGGKFTGAGDINPWSQSKVDRCDDRLLRHEDDPRLVRAFSAKREKEVRATQRLFDGAAVADAERKMRAAIDNLNRALTPDHRFLYGDALTLADLFWAVELIRLIDLGKDSLWNDGENSNVARYVDALCAEPSVQQAIINWPGARLSAWPGAAPMAVPV